MDPVFFKRLERLFAAMDERFTRAAGRFGFACSPCEDNCCMTRFHHHTHLERFYLLEGLRRLPDGERREIETRALSVFRKEQAAQGDSPSRQMCPLNAQGLCILYGFRPMICRLHGISHRLRLPDGTARYGPGCAEFERCLKNPDGEIFDRTPFYREMAALEKEFLEKARLRDRLKMTVSGMLLSGCGGPEPTKDRRPQEPQP